MVIWDKTKDKHKIKSIKICLGCLYSYKSVEKLI